VDIKNRGLKKTIFLIELISYLIFSIKAVFAIKVIKNLQRSQEKVNMFAKLKFMGIRILKR